MGDIILDVPNDSNDHEQSLVFVKGSSWSLLDLVEKFDLVKFWDFAELLNDIQQVLAQAEIVTDMPVTDSERQVLKSHLKEMSKFCGSTGLLISQSRVDNAIHDLPQTSRELDQLIGLVKTELNQRIFIYLEADRAAHFQKGNVIPDQAAAAFPNAGQELRHAGTSYAVSLTSASVYYSMRALEYGLKSLCNNVGSTPVDDNWKNVIDQIEKKINEMRDMPKTSDKNERLQFLSEAANEFRYFKDAWRNYSAHNKIEYDEPQALKIMAHVADFITHLSKKVYEL